MPGNNHALGFRILVLLLIITGMVTLDITYMIRNAFYNTAFAPVLEYGGFTYIESILWLLGVIDFVVGLFVLFLREDKVKYKRRGRSRRR